MEKTCENKKRVLRVVLVDDHTIVREGLRALLGNQEDIRVVGEAEDGIRAVELSIHEKPDVVVLDLAMAQMNGVDAARRIKKVSPDTGVLVLSMHGGPEYVLPAVRAGADGYILKGSGLSDLVNAIRAVGEGGGFFGPEPALHLVSQTRRRAADGKEPPRKSLTSRERDVLELVAKGFSSPNIARKLNISAKTVENHRANIMSKLNIHNLAGLVRYAVRMGIISAMD